MQDAYPNKMNCRLSSFNLWKKVVYSCLIFATVVIIILNLNSVFAIDYSNYTSTKYQIQFQYPTNWNVTEKTDRFDEGAHITIRDGTSGGAIINIIYKEDTENFELLNIRTMTETGLESVTRDDYSIEYRVIESPLYLTIDGHEAGTFVYTAKNKIENIPMRAAQPWNVLANNHYYIISFSSTTDVFDTPDNIQIRDQFIKSIKFLK